MSNDTRTNKALDDFAAILAAETDDAGRARLLARAKMKAMNEAPQEAFEPDVTRLDDYLAREIPIPPSLVWPTIAVRGEITATLGRAGKGKTTMNLNRIFAWSAGRSLFPGWEDNDGMEYLKPERPLRTLIAENEGNAGMFHQKVGLLVRQGDLTEEEQEMCVENIWVHGNGGYSGMKLDNDEGLNKLRRDIEGVKDGLDIIFIEPFRSLWSGEENSSTDMAVVVDNMIALATEYDCAVILSHHMKKGNYEEDDAMSAARGSTVLEGAVAVMENFESVKDGEYREMKWSKARYLPPPLPVRMEYDRDSGWYHWVPTEAIDDAILVALREADDEPMNVSALAEELGEKKNKLGARLKVLVSDGKVKKMPSVSSQDGSTGFRYRLPTGDGDSAEGGLAL